MKQLRPSKDPQPHRPYRMEQSTERQEKEETEKQPFKQKKIAEK
jgi:hypothetical protein